MAALHLGAAFAVHHGKQRVGQCGGRAGGRNTASPPESCASWAPMASRAAGGICRTHITLGPDSPARGGAAPGQSGAARAITYQCARLPAPSALARLRQRQIGARRQRQAWPAPSANGVAPPR